MSCERCGGLKIVDHFYGTTAGTSAWSYEGLRCLNCGHITDLPGAGKNGANGAVGTYV